jgi:hypothetical protein
MEKDTNPQDDRAARMNKFFEEMNQKIDKVETPKPKQETLRMSDKERFFEESLNEKPTQSREIPKPPVEEKQSFLDAMKELKNELDPLADKAMNSAFDKVQDLYGKAEEKAKGLFGQFDKYTDDLEARLKAKEEEHELKRKARAMKEDVSESLFKGKEDLFSKAEDFLNKSKGAAESAIKKGEMIIEKLADKPKKKDPNEKIYGLDDADGDGNPYIDDAIIED